MIARWTQNVCCAWVCFSVLHLRIAWAFCALTYDLTYSTRMCTYTDSSAAGSSTQLPHRRFLFRCILCFAPILQRPRIMILCAWREMCCWVICSEQLWGEDWLSKWDQWPAVHCNWLYNTLLHMWKRMSAWTSARMRQISCRACETNLVM